MTHDAGVLHQALDVCIAECRDHRDIPVRERAAIVLALGENGAPAQPRLRTLEREEFEAHPIVMNRNAPLRIVIDDVERFRGPGAACHACGLRV